MKKLAVLLALTAATAFAADETPAAPAEAPEAFPGVKVVMSPEEFARAGLSSLTPDQLGLIDAAIIRHYTRTVATAANKKAAVIVQKSETEKKQGILERFGLKETPFSQDWRNIPNLKAHCTGWVGTNAFKLDNGQIWEGTEPITVEVADRDIEVAARPGGEFALIVNGENTTIRIQRIK